MRIIQIMIIILSGKCPTSDIGAARISQIQGEFRSVQLFGAWTHQVQRCAADILQPVSCETCLGSHRLDLVLIRPPDIDNGAFTVSPDTVSYARVLLLFASSARSDTGSKSFDCALVSTFETYDDPQNCYYLHLIYYIYFFHDL